MQVILLRLWILAWFAFARCCLFARWAMPNGRSSLRYCRPVTPSPLLSVAASLQPRSIPTLAVPELWYVYTGIKVPAAASILVEWGRFELVLTQAVAIPHAVIATIEKHLAIFPFCRPRVYWYPAKWAFSTARFAPVQLGFFKLFSTRSVLFGNTLKRLMWERNKVSYYDGLM